MSDVETAVDGAEVAPVETAASGQPEQQAQAPESTEEQVEAQEAKVRNEKGQFVPQERVNEITKARREEERGRIAAERRAEHLEQQLAQYQRQPQSAPASEAPTIEQFNYDLDAWSRAMTDYAVSSASTKAEERLREQATQQQRQQAATSFEAKARTYAAEHPGYDDRVQALDGVVRFQSEVIEAISLSDHGPAIADYLATHLDEADRISRLPAHLAAVQLGRLEAQVSTPKPKPVTNAPSPTPTVKGGSRNPSELRDDMTYEQYKAARQR